MSNLKKKSELQEYGIKEHINIQREKTTTLKREKCVLKTKYATKFHNGLSVLSEWKSVFRCLIDKK